MKRQCSLAVVSADKLLHCNVSLVCQGLAVLRNRGYDSAGMATSSESGLMVSKYASRGEISCVGFVEFCE